MIDREVIFQNMSNFHTYLSYYFGLLLITATGIDHTLLIRHLVTVDSINVRFLKNFTVLFSQFEKKKTFARRKRLHNVTQRTLYYPTQQQFKATGKSIKGLS